MRHVFLFYSLPPSVSLILFAVYAAGWCFQSIPFRVTNAILDIRNDLFVLSPYSAMATVSKWNVWTICDCHKIVIHIHSFFTSHLIGINNLCLFLLFTKQKFNHLNNCLDRLVRVWPQLKGKLSFRSSQMHTHIIFKSLSAFVWKVREKKRIVNVFPHSR